MKTAKIVEKVRAHNGLSYRDALTSVQKNSEKNNNSQSHNNNVYISRSENINSIQSVVPRYIPSKAPNRSVDNSTQTEKTSQTENTEFMKKMSVLLIKLLNCLDLTGENKMLQIFEIVKSVMNIDVSDSFQDMDLQSASLKPRTQKSGATPGNTGYSSGSTFNSHPQTKRALNSPNKSDTQSKRGNRGRSRK